MSAIFHNPALKQINFADERFYTDDDKIYYPSITTILGVYPKGKQFEDWLKAVGMNADVIVEEAGNQGTKVHDAILSLCQGTELFWSIDGVEQYTEYEWIMIMRFNDFFTRYQPKIIATEHKVISHHYKLGYTLDVVLEMEGHRWVVDYKTSKNIHPTHELQVAAIATVWNHEFPDTRIDRTAILHLAAQTRGESKDGKSIQGKGWKLVTEKDFKRNYYEAFRLYEHTRALWDEENPDYKPKNLKYPDRLKLEGLAA